MIATSVGCVKRTMIHPVDSVCFAHPLVFVPRYGWCVLRTLLEFQQTLYGFFQLGVVVRSAGQEDHFDLAFFV